MSANSDPNLSSKVRRRRERCQTLPRMMSPSILNPMLSEMMLASVISNFPFLNNPAMLTSEKSSAGSSMPDAFALEIDKPSTDMVNRPSEFLWGNSCGKVPSRCAVNFPASVASNVEDSMGMKLKSKSVESIVISNSFGWKESPLISAAISPPKILALMEAPRLPKMVCSGLRTTLN